MSFTRGSFDKELVNLKVTLEQMGQDTISYFEEVLTAFFEQDAETARALMQKDEAINKQEDIIQERAIMLIARQQPVASDLRKIICALKIANDIERIADFAVNVCKSTIRLEKGGNLDFKTINKMAELSLKMFAETLNAYMEEDAAKAKVSAETDDEIDKLHSTTLEKLMRETSQFPNSINQLIQIAYVSRYMERVADHVTNIAEQVIYLVKGERFTLNN
ncbi:phosphate signaling complex protein PhoU [Alteribacillus bidgolensis]|uniref:Phosphate-specific transport system accessory protein PhoU n=1 Tax=Alteribacillus bidgolensis TaxID=930129 RepID=A0A1G8MNE2_9BACI|nr:phosphate signaling complex protein PhoU [Alteribacillus bidgolensis]SDI69376.1 phosphate transport system protein [Alteribacillus bidgolensis]